METSFTESIFASTLKPTVISLSERLRVFGAALDEAGRLSGDLFSAEIDQDATHQAVGGLLPDNGETPASATEQLINIAKGGYVNIEPPRSFGSSSIVPWWSIYTFDRTGFLLPPADLRSIGVDPDSTPAMVRERILKLDSRAPSYMLGEDVLSKLIHSARDPYLVELERHVRDPDTTRFPWPTVERPARQHQPGTIDAAATSLGFHVRWWGWEICMDRVTADRVRLFLDYGSNGVAGAIWVLQQFLKFPVNWVVVAALWAISQYLALQIRIANRGSNGCCLQGNWPSPWWGMFAWAVPR